jgi:hypothetical protein
MSWFLGYTGENNSKIESYIKSALPGKFEHYKKDNLKIWYSKNRRNFLSFICGSEAVFLSGIVLSETNNCFPSPDTCTEGHYACTLLKDSAVYLFNDQHGMRDIYYIKEGQNILFSTRIDFISSYLSRVEVNLEELSTLWLLPHQIIPGTKIKGINKLGPGGCLLIKDKNTSLTRKSWLPDFTKHCSVEEFLSDLKRITLFPLSMGNKINLGLSGGIDSRVLLRFLLTAKKENWATHTFGNEHLPDVKSAEKITDGLGIKHYFLQQQTASPAEIINNRLYQLLELSVPIGGMINYAFFKELDSEGYTIIDGGNGELFRRALFNKFLLSGKKALLNKNTETIFNLLKREKADFFNESVNKILKEHALKCLGELLDQFPSPLETGAENWIDMFFVKTSFPNYSGPSQNILDTVSTAYMPFAQNSVLNSGFGLDYSERKNGRLFISIIRQDPRLSKYSLVKDHIYYPFGMGFVPSKIYLKIKKKSGMFYRDNTKFKIISSLKEYALDKINSTDVKNFELYDIRKTADIINGFYLMKKTELLNQADWWLSFEIWRDGLELSNSLKFT